MEKKGDMKMCGPIRVNNPKVKEENCNCGCLGYNKKDSKFEEMKRNMNKE